MQWYETSYENLYTIFLKRNMIDETGNFDIPDGYQSIEKAKILYTENFSLEESLQSLIENTKVLIKKVPPPIPSKPDYLKMKAIKSESEPESEPNPKSEVIVPE